MMTIYTVEIGGIEGGSLALATTDKMEAWRYARREFYRLFYDTLKVYKALKWGMNVMVSGKSYKRSALYVDKVAHMKGVTWYVGHDYVSFKIWK